MNWFLESNRYKHFLGAIPCGMISFFFALGLATGMEAKDKLWGGEWDWLDFGCTVAGGAVGAVIMQLIKLYVI